jgi:L-amino acid N-acyltransferase YncA
MEEAARPATEDDIPRLAELVRAAVAELRPLRGGDVWAAGAERPEPVEDALRAVHADEGQLLLAGTLDSSVLGYAVARTQTLRDGRILGVVDDIYVESGARAVGLGEAMMDAVVAWCAERDCFGIDAVALPGARETKNFFETFGFTARLLVVHRRL